jgi:hypothetical protein
MASFIGIWQCWRIWLWQRQQLKAAAAIQPWRLAFDETVSRQKLYNQRKEAQSYVKTWRHLAAAGVSRRNIWRGESGESISIKRRIGMAKTHKWRIRRRNGGGGLQLAPEKAAASAAKTSKQIS